MGHDTYERKDKSGHTVIPCLRGISFQSRNHKLGIYKFLKSEKYFTGVSSSGATQKIMMQEIKNALDTAIKNIEKFK